MNRNTHQVVEADLGALLGEHEPPRVTTNRCDTDVSANDHVAEEQPASNERLIPLPWGALHHVMVLGIETKGGGGKTVGDKVDPEQLHGDECLGHTHGSGQEN